MIRAKENNTTEWKSMLIGLLLISSPVVTTIATAAENGVVNTLNIVQETDEIPSLDLLLYLGEFQDRDGSLLEPEYFDNSLKLNDEEDKLDNDDQSKPKLSSINKEDDHEKSQP